MHTRSKISRRIFIGTALGSATLGCAGAPFASREKNASVRSGRYARIDGVETARRIRDGEISAREVLEKAIARIEELQPKLNFLVTDNFDGALADVVENPVDGPLAGVPYLVKDLNDVAGLPTRQGSRITVGAKDEDKQDGYISATLNAGVIVLGKSATPERGYSATTEPLAFGPTRNPWNTSHTPGGSSGGAAVAVASGVVPMAHANDGGGSIRIPASCCGVFGMKPSRGRLQSDGPGSSPIDFATQGCVSVSVRDTAVITAATEAENLPDSLSRLGLVSQPVRRRLRIGVIDLSDSGKHPEIEVQNGLDATRQLLSELGHQVEDARWPMDITFMRDFTTFWSAGAARTVRRARQHLGAEPDENSLEPFTLGLAAHAEQQGAEGIGAAVERLKIAAQQYHTLAEQFDILLSPVLRRTPVEIGFLAPDVLYDTLVERLIDFMGYTPIHNISGAPAMSVPLHWTSSGLPVGMQFFGPLDSEKLLLELAYQLEEAKPWSHKRPPIFAT